jgi:hypothetical protein
MQLGQWINYRYYRIERPNSRKIGFTAHNVSSGLCQQRSKFLTLERIGMNDRGCADGFEPIF